MLEGYIPMNRITDRRICRTPPSSWIGRATGHAVESETDGRGFGRPRRGGLAKSCAALGLATGLAVATSGCAAAVGAALAAGEIGQGIAGLQQLLAFSRDQPAAEVELPEAFATPLAGTYRGFQVLDGDTVGYYVRTARQPVAAIVDQSGTVTGYALSGIAAASLDSLEARVRQRSDPDPEPRGGRTVFFVEGTQPPSPGARALYPGAFLGRVASGESRTADRQYRELIELELEMDAPGVTELSGQSIPHELFGTVAEGVFTVRPDGAVVYHQEYEVSEDRLLVLHFERISETTLPD
jgi:hypothetical protein